MAILGTRKFLQSRGYSKTNPRQDLTPPILVPLTHNFSKSWPKLPNSRNPANVSLLHQKRLTPLPANTRYLTSTLPPLPRLQTPHLPQPQPRQIPHLPRSPRAVTEPASIDPSRTPWRRRYQEESEGQGAESGAEEAAGTRAGEGGDRDG